MTTSGELSTRSVTKRFGAFTAIDDVSITVRRGELRAVIGPNGAGKTTLFNVISGALTATSGDVVFEERNVTWLPGHRRVHLGIAKAFQTANIFPEESVLQNCRLAALARLQGSFAPAFFRRSTRLTAVAGRAETALEAVDLADRRDARAGDLSHGDQKRLDIAIALATEPKVLLLDEPVAGMSLQEAQKTAELIRRLAGSMTVLLIEHDMDIIMGISDTITVLHQGKVLAEGSPAEVRNNEAVKEAYLGGHARVRSA